MIIAADNSTLPKPGDTMSDGSIYIGISDDTGTPFYLFVRGLDRQKTSANVTFDSAMNILTNKHNNNKRFCGHKFSAFQQEKEIITSYKNSTADGGVRLLTKKEWAQVNIFLENKTELHDKIAQILNDDHNRYIQTATPLKNNFACYALLGSNKDYDFRRDTSGYLLLGRSDPKP